MAGYRILRATKNESLSNSKNKPIYIGVSGTLKIPTAYAAVNDSAPEVYDGVFPELFYGFYAGSYGIDIGLIFRDQVWKVFVQSPNALSGTTYGESAISPTLRPDDVIEVKSYLGGTDQICIDVYKGGTKIKSFIGKLKPAAYTAFKGGSYVNKEMNIATNRTSGYLKTGAYFTNAHWYDCTLTTTSYSYVKWDDTFGHVIINKDGGDDREIWDRNLLSHSASVSNGYVKDIASIDFRPYKRS